ncbi:metaxin-1 isoform X3 [Temnothorax nylanderi]|uniref:metaxin-1 isoform X3 n=1 Tax=Temnothorax nylanderi TaxID=102681 RepID=UPI003A85E13D
MCHATLHCLPRRRGRGGREGFACSLTGDASFRKWRTPRCCSWTCGRATGACRRSTSSACRFWWIDKKNLDELVRPWYCKALSFPFNFYYPGKFERQAHALMQSLYPLEDNINVIENEVYSEAQKCLTLLSTRLGDRDFFCGQQPNAIDAVVYSYLAPLLKAPLPNPVLQNHLKACTNLVKYVSRISQRYFEIEYQTYEKHRAEKNAERLRRDSESEFPNKRRNQILAALVAILAMTGYALSTGIVEVLVYLLRSRKFIKIPKKNRKRTSKG